MESDISNELVLDESIYRFNVLSAQLFEEDDVWYSMRASENRIFYGNCNNQISKARRIYPQRRYFNCFYDSFKKHEDIFYTHLLSEVLKQEFVERLQLNEYEYEEFCGICQYAGCIFGVFEWSRMRSLSSSLTLTGKEELERRIIQNEFYNMLLEALCILEILHRRTILFIEEPFKRCAIENCEVPDWIESRRRQVTRERFEEIENDSNEKQNHLEYIYWKRQQIYQLSLFQQSEEEERRDVERLQRLHAGIIAEIFYNERKEAFYYQLKYEFRQRLLPEEISKNIIIEEANKRSAIMISQHDHYRALQADEVKSYLWTKRNMMINENVEQSRNVMKSMHVVM